MAKKQVVVEKGGFTLTFRITADRQGIEVDVMHGGKLVLEWEYPKLPGSLADNVEFWTDQAILEARGKMRG